MYIAIVGWLLLSGFICFNEKKKVNSPQIVFSVLFFSLLICVMGLRHYSVGTDTKAYYDAFNTTSNYTIMQIINGEINLTMEKLYLLSMKIFSSTINNYYLFQFCYSIIYIIGIVYFFYRNSDDLWFTATLILGLDMFLIAFNIQRQMLAVMVCLLIWEKIKKKQWFVASILGLVAVNIHNTAIIFILFSFIYFFRNNKKILRAATVVIILCSLRYQNIIKWLSSYYPEYRNYYSNHKVLQTAGLIWIIWGIILTISLIYLFKSDVSKTDSRVYAVFSIIYVIFNIVGLYFNYAERIGLYFLPFVILLFVDFKSILPSKSAQQCYKYITSACFLAYFILSSQSYQYSYTLCF